MNTDITSQFFDHSIRIERLIHIGLQMVDESLPSDVEDSFRSDIDEIAAALGVDVNELADGFDEGNLSWDMRVKYKRQGYLVQFATPIPTSFSDDGDSHTHSWGFYSTEWIYGETIEDCCNAALTWRHAFIADKKAKSLAGKQSENV